MSVQPRNVLFIDDEPEFVRYYLDDLREHDVDVTHISDTSLAALRIEEGAEKYDTVVVDLMLRLPDLDIGHGSESSGASPEDLHDGSPLVGRWILDRVPDDASVVVLTNIDVGQLEWIDAYNDRFKNFVATTKQSCPGFDFFDFLSHFHGPSNGNSAPQSRA